MDIRKTIDKLVEAAGKEVNALESIEGSTEYWAHDAQDCAYQVNDLLKAIQAYLYEYQEYELNNGKWFKNFKEEWLRAENKRKKIEETQEKEEYERLKKKFGK